jgi:hypothetical protein
VERLDGKPKYSEKFCPTAALSTTKPALPDLGWNPGRRGVKPATNLLSYGTTFHTCQRLSRTEGLIAIRSIENASNLVWNRNRDVTACSTEPRPTTLPCAPKHSSVTVYRGRGCGTVCLRTGWILPLVLSFKQRLFYLRRENFLELVDKTVWMGHSWEKELDHQTNAQPL